jgi:hypothetical protein
VSRCPELIVAWSSPVDPVGGTVITVAYAVANILDPIRWLRLMAGNADPPGSGYVLTSDSVSAVSWKSLAQIQAPSGLICLWNATTPPVGWTIYTAWGGLFFVGAGGPFAFGGVGGATQHQHTIGHDHGMSHTHGISHDHDMANHSHQMTHGHSHTHTHGTPNHGHNAGPLGVGGSTGGVNEGLGSSFGGSGSSTIGAHTHAVGGLDVSGSIGSDGAGTTAVPDTATTTNSPDYVQGPTVARTGPDSTGGNTGGTGTRTDGAPGANSGISVQLPPYVVGNYVIKS